MEKRQFHPFLDAVGVQQILNLYPHGTAMLVYDPIKGIVWEVRSNYDSSLLHCTSSCVVNAIFEIDQITHFLQLDHETVDGHKQFVPFHKSVLYQFVQASGEMDVITVRAKNARNKV
jgi:hypothetical protein